MRFSKHDCQLAKTIQLAGTVVHAPCRYSRVGKEMVSVPSWTGCDCFCPNRLLARAARCDKPHADSSAASHAAYSGNMWPAVAAAAHAFLKNSSCTPLIFPPKINGGSPRAAAVDFSLFPLFHFCR